MRTNITAAAQSTNAVRELSLVEIALVSGGKKATDDRPKHLTTAILEQMFTDDINAHRKYSKAL